jgi:hypothetical protein
VVLALYAWLSLPLPFPYPLPFEVVPAEAPSKKARWLAEKADAVPPAHAPPVPARAAAVPFSLYNVWTHEILPVPPEQPPPADMINRFLRCHFTNQSTKMDGRLLPTILRAARRFRAWRIEIVSGFRSPKYNLILRKKGHEVARESEHPRGEAVDFRLPQVPTRALLRFVRSLHLGGVGFYPESQFVHADVGRVRFWRGH